MSYSWSARARDVIREATKGLPDDTPLVERMKIVDAAYPFGERRYWPYKMWLKARYDYLHGFGYQKRGDPQPLLPLLSPLERARQKALGS